MMTGSAGHWQPSAQLGPSTKPWCSQQCASRSTKGRRPVHHHVHQWDHRWVAGVSVQLTHVVCQLLVDAGACRLKMTINQAQKMIWFRTASCCCIFTSLPPVTAQQAVARILHCGRHGRQVHVIWSPLLTTIRRCCCCCCGAGDPKGVMITHGNLVAAIAGCNQYLESFNETLGEEDCYLSFLPLAHVFDRCAHRQWWETLCVFSRTLPCSTMSHHTIPSCTVPHCTALHSDFAEV